LRPKKLIVVLSIVASLAGLARAEVAVETTGQVERLSEPFQPHWVWVSDLILQRTALIDLDENRFLGMINGGWGTILPIFPRSRPEIYVPATYYSRGTRGERTDVLEIYDAPTLSPVAEVIIPSRRANNAVALGHTALSDDDRLVALFNWTTGTSLSIVDVENRVFAGEVTTPGCSLVFAAGARRFFSICADGSIFIVVLDEAGHELRRSRSEPFFDPRQDPVTEKAVRYGDTWLFVSFDGMVHPVDVSGEEIQFGDEWPLLSPEDRQRTWRIGGMQHLAVHAATRRLFVLVHRGGPDTHKDAGEEVWIYDISTRRRIDRVELLNPGLTIYGFPIELGVFEWLLDTFAPAYVSHIQVTRDDEPLLLTASQFSGSIGVYDAMSGDFLRRVQPTGWTSDVMLTPWGGQVKP
jgi:methylamine dehydrogenase heavy chain